MGRENGGEWGSILSKEDIYIPILDSIFGFIGAYQIFIFTLFLWFSFNIINTVYIYTYIHVCIHTYIYYLVLKDTFISLLIWEYRTQKKRFNICLFCVYDMYVYRHICGCMYMCAYFWKALRATWWRPNLPSRFGLKKFMACFS